MNYQQLIDTNPNVYMFTLHYNFIADKLSFLCDITDFRAYEFKTTYFWYFRNCPTSGKVEWLRLNSLILRSHIFINSSTC